MKAADEIEGLTRALTWEVRGWFTVHVSIDVDVDIYLSDPHPPWQRGTNENR